MANAQLQWKPNDRATLWLRGEYRGKSQRFDGNPSALTGNNQREYQALGDLKGYALFISVVRTASRATPRSR